ncbi:MAG: hypothetical protein GW949_04225 [Spirochaetales bacterium]|nr:hypothetical protein [Spirochaetales bacterium]
MKKIALLLALILVGALAFGQAINLGNFPLGSYVDQNYDAVWEFTSSNIRILSLGGEVLFDFGQNTVRDFRVGLEGTSPMITFSCDESQRSYTFVKPLTSQNVNMQFQAPWNSNYQVTLVRR